MKVHAVVLAGGDGSVIDPDAPFKGAVSVSGKPMVEWVVRALLSANSIERVAVVVPSTDGLGEWADDVEVVVSDGSFIENMSAGFAVLPGDVPVFISTSDVPALAPEAIDDFVAQALGRDAEFAYAVVREDCMEEHFPGSKRTYIPMSSGRVTGGNVALLAPWVLERNREFGQQLFERRKSALLMARLLGPRVVLGLAAKRLKPESLERRMGRLLGARSRAVFTSHACIGADVDKPEDVHVVERVL